MLLQQTGTENRIAVKGHTVCSAEFNQQQSEILQNLNMELLTF